MTSNFRWRLSLDLAIGLGICCAIPLGLVLYGWLQYRYLERSIVSKMDQYYLNISSSGHEEYLLESDQMFEVPYMASRLSVQAVPTRIFDSQGRLIGEFISEKGLYVRSPEDLPALLKKAVVATEDGTFYRHHGVNWKAITRAQLVNLRHLRFRQGGSTITQQLAKLLFTTRRKTYARKVFELFCAWKLEEKFTKDQILLMYLNFAYYGHGCFGIESAARFYFGKTTSQLELNEAALLAGIINNPTNFSPLDNPALARARHRTVLTRMAKLGFISSSIVDRALDEFWGDMALRTKAPEASFWRMKLNEAPYVTELVRRELEKTYSKERILKGGLRVYTTIDLELQKQAEVALKRGLYEENQLFLKGHPQEKSRIEGALAAVRPSDGAVLAFVGGGGFNFQNQLNRAMDIHRPVGSSIKPFVYAVALATAGFHPEDKMLDAPVRFPVEGGRTWQPRNYGNVYHGEVTLSVALAKSLNSVAVKLLKEVGVRDVAHLFLAASDTSSRLVPRDLSLALGTAEASSVQMAAAFSIFMNGGIPVKPYVLARLEDRDGTVLYEAVSSTANAVPLLDPTVRRMMVEMMQGVFQEGGTAYYAASRAGFTIPAAGKTGTTDDYRDAWFTGFTSDVAASVWVGHDDHRVSIGQDRTGGSVAGTIWMQFMKSAYQNRPTRSLEPL